MLVVLDPNVLISAALSATGAPAQLIRRWLEGEFELLVSPALLVELGRVLAHPKIAARIPAEDAAALIGLLESEGNRAPDPAARPSIRGEDPDDEYLIALALAHGAAIVSGDDSHLTALSDRLPIYRPADFLRQLEQSSPGS